MLIHQETLEDMDALTGWHREDDMRVVYLGSTGMTPTVSGIEVWRENLFPGPLPREKKEGVWEAWRFDQGKLQKKIVRVFTTPLERRPDTEQLPRKPALLGNPKSSEAIWVMTRPLMLGVDNVFIPICARGPPCMGLSTQLTAWIPFLDLLRVAMDLRLGDVVRVEVTVQERRSILFLAVSRVDARDVEDEEVALRCLRYVLDHVAARGPRTLALHRLPGLEERTYAEQLATLERMRPAGIQFALCPGKIDYDEEWMPEEWTWVFDGGIRGGNVLQ